LSVAPKIASRTCKSCQHYFPTIKAKNDHHKASICFAEEQDDTEEEIFELETPNIDFEIEEESIMPVLDVNDMFRAVFVGIEDEEEE
jgi:hypothetical protein